MQSLVVTVVGADRPGLVSLIADRGRQHGASWDQSRMATLAGQFAGIVHFQVPAAAAAALTTALRELESTGLSVVVVAGMVPCADTGAHPLWLELVGQDRPGIVRDISRALAELGVSIHELTTEVTSAAMSGEHLFHASALLQMPANVATDELQRVLEALANELMVDVNLHEAPTASG